MKNHVRKIVVILIVLLLAAGVAYAKNVKVECPTCNGYKRVYCSSCGGSGKIEKTRNNGSTYQADCPNCAGGTVRCPTCSGTGTVTRWVDE